MPHKELKTKTIEDILKEETIAADAVKAAVSRYNEERKKKQEQVIIDTLGDIDHVISLRVERLRRIRAEEKQVRQSILNIAAAKEAYLKNLDREKLVSILANEGFYLAE